MTTHHRDLAVGDIEQRCALLLSGKLAYALLLFALFLGCTEVPATNPFDPGTPAPQQAAATLIGRLDIEGVSELAPEPYSIMVRDARSGFILDENGERRV